MKEELKCYQSIKFKEGKFKKNGKEVEYVNILSKELVNKKINSIKESMKKIEEELEMFNSNNITAIDLYNIETFNIASKIL